MGGEWSKAVGDLPVCAAPDFSRLPPLTAASESASQLSSTGAPAPQAAVAGDSKRARQNAAKRDATKAAKASAEAERLATLARHKRELERTKMDEQYSTGSGRGRGKVSGGMKASVDANGKLVWD